MYYSVTECRLVTKLVHSNFFYFEQVNVHINTKVEMSEVRLKLCFVLFYELYWSESL